MGQELDCRLHYQKRTVGGKAYLETDHLLFRGEDRLKIPLRDLTRVRAADGQLQLEFPGGQAALDLGPAAEKWARKILQPPTRAGKLGIKPGLSVRMAGEFEADFLGELQDCLIVTRGEADLVFYAASTSRDLGSLKKLTKWLKSSGALWVVYPKGVPAIREIEVLAGGRAAGLKDVKVASFSATHTALKFVVPVAQRGKR